MQEQPIEAGPPDDATEEDLAVPVPPPVAAAPGHIYALKLHILTFYRI